MGKFPGPSPKCHRIWSNCRELVQGIVDEAGHLWAQERSKFQVSLVHSYVDKRGVRRHTGKKRELRESQSLA